MGLWPRTLDTRELKIEAVSTTWILLEDIVNLKTR
jgi:hypothetical protein